MAHLTRQPCLEYALMGIYALRQAPLRINHDVDDLSLLFNMHAFPPCNHEWMSLEEG